MRCITNWLLFTVLLAVSVCKTAGQSTSDVKCPHFNLFRSLEAVVVGDRVMFNIVATGGNLKPGALRYEWKVFPKGKIVTSPDTSAATLNTSTVGGNWAIVSADFANWRQCNWHESYEIKIRRKGPYTMADAFWWWFHLHENDLRAFNEPDYKNWQDSLGGILALVDDRLTFKIDADRPDPMKQAFIIGYSGTPYDAKLLRDFVARAPNLAGWEFLVEKHPQ